MATAYTSLLGLALPVTGELSGTWGATVNDEITALLDSAVAGTTSITADADITLSDTDGAANETRQAVILWNPATGTTTRNITAPARSKAYIVINASGGTQSIVLRGAGPTTGVTIVKGEKALCAWDGSDFVKVANQNGIGNFTTVDTTNLEVTNLKALDGTAAGSIANSTGVVTLASSVLTTTDINGGTIDGTAIGGSTAAAGAFTTLSATGVTTVQAGTAAAPAITTTGDTNTGIFFPAADTIAFSEGGVESMRIDVNRNVGIGTVSPSVKLHVVSNATYDPLRLESTVSGYERSWTIGPNVGISGQFVIRDTTASANRVYIDSAGNMGLGTTASAWDTNRKAFQIGGSGALWTSTSGNGTLFLSNNTYFDGTNFRYLTTGATTYYALATDGSYAWYRAASGTAGNVVTFTTAMNLDASSNLQFNSGYGSVATAYGCRAWVNFDGTGTVAIRNSGNVSSITDFGVGDYYVNFANVMPDGNYSAAGSVTASGGGAYVLCPDHAGAYPTNYLRVQVSTGAGTTTDRPVVNVAVFR